MLPLFWGWLTLIIIQLCVSMAHPSELGAMLGIVLCGFERGV